MRPIGSWIGWGSGFGVPVFGVRLMGWGEGDWTNSLYMSYSFEDFEHYYSKYNGDTIQLHRRRRR